MLPIAVALATDVVAQHLPLSSGDVLPLGESSNGNTNRCLVHSFLPNEHEAVVQATLECDIYQSQTSNGEPVYLNVWVDARKEGVFDNSDIDWILQNKIVTIDEGDDGVKVEQEIKLDIFGGGGGPSRRRLNSVVSRRLQEAIDSTDITLPVVQASDGIGEELEEEEVDFGALLEKEVVPIQKKDEEAGIILEGGKVRIAKVPKKVALAQKPGEELLIPVMDDYPRPPLPNPTKEEAAYKPAGFKPQSAKPRTYNTIKAQIEAARAAEGDVAAQELLESATDCTTEEDRVILSEEYIPSYTSHPIDGGDYRSVRFRVRVSLEEKYSFEGDAEEGEVEEFVLFLNRKSLNQ